MPELTPERKRALQEVFKKHGLGRGRGYRRHSAEVTSDRLGDAVERWHDQFTGEERDMISQIRDRLERIAAGEEA